MRRSLGQRSSSPSRGWATSTALRENGSGDSDEEGLPRRRQEGLLDPSPTAETDFSMGQVRRRHGRRQAPRPRRYYYDSGQVHGELGAREAGHGVYVYANGDRYVGNWAGGKHHGEGTGQIAKSGKHGLRAARRRGTALSCTRTARSSTASGTARSPTTASTPTPAATGTAARGSRKKPDRHLLLCSRAKQASTRTARHGTAVFIEADAARSTRECGAVAGGRRAPQSRPSSTRRACRREGGRRARRPTTPPSAWARRRRPSPRRRAPRAHHAADLASSTSTASRARPPPPPLRGAYAPDADFDAFFTAPPAGMAPAAAPATDSSLLDLLGSPDAAPTTAAATVVSGPDLLL